MAKRKTARPGARSRGRGAAAARTAKKSGTSRSAKAASTRSGGGRAAGGRRKTAKQSPSAKAAGSRKRPAARKPARRAQKTAATRRPAAAKRSARSSRNTGAAARARSRKVATRTTKKAASPRGASRPRGTSPSTPPRKAFGKRGRSLHDALERDRRLLEETVESPPSSLDLNRRASAARTGRAEIEQALSEHTETGPALTGGDVDADWESAYSTGDEAPGGDMPTPDQSIVEEIGTAIGVEYNDNEELKGVDKVEQRDRHRWEYDPASSEDYQERTRRK